MFCVEESCLPKKINRVVGMLGLLLWWTLSTPANAKTTQSCLQLFNGESIHVVQPSIFQDPVGQQILAQLAESHERVALIVEGRAMMAEPSSRDFQRYSDYRKVRELEERLREANSMIALEAENSSGNLMIESQSDMVAYIRSEIREIERELREIRDRATDQILDEAGLLHGPVVIHLQTLPPFDIEESVAEQLAGMYRSYSARFNWKFQVLESTPTLIKLKVEGKYAFAMLQGENGKHKVIFQRKTNAYRRHDKAIQNSVQVIVYRVDEQNQKAGLISRRDAMNVRQALAVKSGDSVAGTAFRRTYNSIDNLVVESEASSDSRSRKRLSYDAVMNGQASDIFVGNMSSVIHELMLP